MMAINPITEFILNNQNKIPLFTRKDLELGVKALMKAFDQAEIKDPKAYLEDPANQKNILFLFSVGTKAQNNQALLEEFTTNALLLFKNEKDFKPQNGRGNEFSNDVLQIKFDKTKRFMLELLMDPQLKEFFEKLTKKLEEFVPEEKLSPKKTFPTLKPETKTEEIDQLEEQRNQAAFEEKGADIKGTSGRTHVTGTSFGAGRSAGTVGDIEVDKLVGLVLMEFMLDPKKLADDELESQLDAVDEADEIKQQDEQTYSSPRPKPLKTNPFE